MLFWLAVVLAATLLLHMLVLTAFLFSRWKTPNLLHFPRPELLVLLIALAAIAQGAASKALPCPTHCQLSAALAMSNCVLSRKHKPEC